MVLEEGGFVVRAEAAHGPGRRRGRAARHPHVRLLDATDARRGNQVGGEVRRNLPDTAIVTSTRPRTMTTCSM